jgi:glycosyltransferase involved in cell wall biosynthesis
MYKVSIILTIYNNSQFLNNCLRSILNQSLLPNEVILVDDGSIDDNTKNIYLKFKKIKKVNFRFFKIKNIGPSGARNFGLKKIKYDYFCFFDPDDFMHKNFINNRLQIFKRNLNQKIIGVYSNIKFLKNNKYFKIKYKKKLSNYEQINTIGYPNGVCGALQSYIFFKPLIPKFLKLDEKIIINEDFDFIIRLFKNNFNTYGVDKFDIIINMHEDSLTRSRKNIKLIYINQKKFINKAIKNKYFTANEVGKR